MEPLKRTTPAWSMALAALVLSALGAAGTGMEGEAPEDAPGKRGSKEAAKPGEKKPPAPGGEETELSPRAEGKTRPLRLAAGENHLLVVLQALADVSGLKVVLGGGNDGRQTIRLPKEIEADRDSITGALIRAGYSVNEEPFRGRQVLWVTRELKPAPRRGTILRPGEKAEAPPGGTAAPSRQGGVRVFQEGEAGAAAWLVVLETRSRAEAEEAATLLRSYLQGRSSRRGVPGSEAGRGDAGIREKRGE